MKKAKVILSTAMLAGAVALMLPVQACSEKELDEKEDPSLSLDNEEEEALSPDETEESSSATTINGHEYVDLGLSVKWAACNVGADEPWEYGGYYAWGETETKPLYTLRNSVTYDLEIGVIAGDPEYDVARAVWGGTWRLPTVEEIDELVRNCTHTRTTQNDVEGCLVTGPNGNSIFLPAAGWRNGTSLNSAGDYGGYWSATPSEELSYGAYYLNFLGGFFYRVWYNRDYGLSVRPVSE